MLGFWWMLCAMINAWAADRAAKRRDYAWATFSIAVCLLCVWLWFGEAQ